MSLLESIGLKSTRKVRYGIVSLGDITQVGLLPGVKHTGNSEVAALISGDEEKARAVASQYGLDKVYHYSQYQQLLQSGEIEAVYIASPNWRHSEFAVPALEAGVNVLLEKPMEVSSAECRKILSRVQPGRTKLMIAYRLHFEPATLRILEIVRSGQLGKIISFTSVFAQKVKPENHRVKKGVLAGPLFDMGPYPINAARNIFGTDPVTVWAKASRSPDSGFGDLDDTVSVTMAFPDNKLAQFTVSYLGNSVDSYTIVGTEGSLVVSPCYTYQQGLEFELTIGGKKTKEKFKHTDHFGGEMKYFSDCILQNREPEPDGEEGLRDVQVIESILQSIASGQSVRLELSPRGKSICLENVQKLGSVAAAELVGAESPSE